jgi:hypothetical protein
MKLNLLIPFGIIIFLNGLVCSATTLIVDNHFPTPAGEYATIQLAYNAASTGDTILISPSEGEYTGMTITKQIHIVGNGWTRPSASVPNTKTSGFIFNPGAQGSSITGLEVNGLFDILTSNITIKRNKCQSIYVRANCTDVVIMQNIIQSSRSIGGLWYGSSMISLWENTEVFISNNIIINTYYGSASVNGIYNLYPGSLIVCNNIIKVEDYSINFSMSEGNYTTHSIYNNIVLEGEISAVIGSYNNIGNSTQFPATDGNQQNVVMSDVFEDPDNNDFHLKVGSPAIGAGFEGADCGIYGGTLGFVDNGRSWLPIITEVDVPVIVNKADGLDITVKAKSGN